MARNRLRFLGYVKEAKKTLQLLPRQNRSFWRLCAALIYWCEGAKRNLSNVQFTNSDPKLVSLFLYALRLGFNLDEKRLSALVHLHEYHNEERQLALWSKVTRIPLVQFTKTYWKPHTKIRQRENYPGCINVRYGDASVARRLNAIYTIFADNYTNLKGA